MAKKKLPEGFRKIDGRVFFRQEMDSNRKKLEKIAERKKKSGKYTRILWSRKHLKYGLYIHDKRIKIN